MRALIACESSGAVRRAFMARGILATSVDFLPADDGATSHSAGSLGYHIQGDVRAHIRQYKSWYGLMIAHPPCTYLCSSGLHWNARVPGRSEKTEEALRFVAELWNCGIPRIAIENPQGCINTRLPFMPKPQYIQPYEFGHDASKKTGLWMRGLPPLIPTKRIAGRIVNGKERWANQTDSGQNRLPPSEDRWKIRSATYSGIADAMATQWGDLIAREAA